MMLRGVLAVSALTMLSGCSLWEAMFASPPLKPVAGAPDADAWTRYVPWDSKRTGVRATGSGLEYIMLATGPADGERASEKSLAEVHYEGRFNRAGSEAFDSSFADSETAVFPVGEVVPGFSEALQLMRPGDSILAFVPAKLGYGERGAGGVIPPNADLVFEIELKSVRMPPMADNAAWSKHVPWKSNAPEVKKTGTSLEYIVLASGPPGGAPPARSDDAEIFYEGRLNSGGGAFDSAFDRGETATFPVNAVVPGFSEALQLMKPGDRWLVFIPSALGYGARGAGRDIPPNADLVFEIEMVSVP